MRQILIDNARYYTGNGISITLTDDRKVSIGSWKEFQSRFITGDELQQRSENAKGLAIICGKVSGNLEVIDIDLKYDHSGSLWKELMSAIPESIMDKLTIASTKSGGFHLYYRCTSVSPNSKLARRPATDDEIQSNPNLKVFVLIETRGEGGYVVAPPTDGYQWVSGTADTIATITDAEKEELWSICRSFNQYLEAPEPIQESYIGLSPLDDFNLRGDAIGLLVKHGWKIIRTTKDKTIFRRPGKDEGTSGDWIESKRWFSVFTTSSQFEPQKAYNASALYCILECGGNWKQCTAKLAENGYGKDEKKLKKQSKTFSMIARMKENGDGKDEIIRQLTYLDQVDESEALLTLKRFEDVEEFNKLKFWELGKNDRVIINKPKLINFLEVKGFRVMPYDTAGNDVRLVHVENNIVEETSIEKIKRVIYDFVLSLKSDESEPVASAILDKHQLFNVSFLEFMPRIKNDFLKDEPKVAYFAFLNGIVKVDTESTSIISYKSVNKYIWRSHIIPRHIEVTMKVDEHGNVPHNVLPGGEVFPRFIFLISDSSFDRFQAVQSHIGYCIHKYKDPKLPVAIILAEETDNDNKGGGTGKGIFTTAIGKLIQTQTIDGKNFRLDKSFAWQRVGLDTNAVIIQDVRKNVDFEGFYPAITDGLTIERKGQQEIFLDYDHSPKLLITTNYSIPDVGNHAKRRQRVIPFSDYFSHIRTPHDEFNQQLFSDWDDGEWKVFYNFMFDCTRIFLTKGIVNIPQSDSMRLKALKVAYGAEFKDYFDGVRLGSFPTDWKPFGELYRDFLTSFDMSEQEFSKKRYRSAMQAGCDAFGLRLETENKGRQGGINYRISVNDF